MDKVNGTITRNAKNNHSLILLFILSGLIIPLNSFADEIFWGELTGGKFDFSARYRYEHVDDNIASDQADASTLRTTLGYTTGIFHDFGARILLQDVRDIGVDDFNDATGRPNAKTNFAVVADPSETDFLEGYIILQVYQTLLLKLVDKLLLTARRPFIGIWVPYYGAKTGKTMTQFPFRTNHYRIQQSTMPIPEY